MEDYYKILGLKKTASEEEIRARWIELTKHYHPDLTGSHGVGEKIKEINEAYQILKFSSTRTEYDLERNYYRRMRKLGAHRAILPVGLLTLFLIVGSIFLIKFKSPYLSPPNIPPDPSSHKVAALNVNPVKKINQKNHINEIDERNQRNQRNQVDQANKAEVKMLRLSTPHTTQKKIDGTTQRPNDTNDHRLSAPTDAMIPMTQTTPINAITSVSAVNQINQIDPKNETNQINERDENNPIVQVAQFNPPSPIAKEQEVRQFFDNYIERYDQMDIEGFLSLFSLKAVQNQKDGLEQIQEIYANFFNQCREVRYHLKDMKIEIYQNAVEVKARYELDQILKKGGGKKVWRGRARWVLGKENGALRILSLDYQHQKSP